MQHLPYNVQHVSYMHMCSLILCLQYRALLIMYRCRYGVNCCPTTPSILAGGCASAFAQSVAVLELVDFNLFGSLPPEMGNLTSLSA